MGEKRRAHRILLGSPEVKRPLGMKDVCGQTMV
jgi:hypothetical protein